MLLSQFPLTFYHIPNEMPYFIAFIGFIAYDYSFADWDGLCNHLRDVPWEDIFKLSASAAASEFREWVQLGIESVSDQASLISVVFSSLCCYHSSYKLLFSFVTKG